MHTYNDKQQLILTSGHYDMYTKHTYNDNLRTTAYASTNAHSSTMPGCEFRSIKWTAVKSQVTQDCIDPRLEDLSVQEFQELF